MLLIFLTTAIDYWCGLKIEDSSDRKTKKFFVAVSVISNLVVLGFFKYFNFFSESLNALLGRFGVPAFHVPWHIILPVGISFYTFQSMSYVIDVYRSDIKAARNFFDFALFVSFFPQLVAGPIERASHLLPQVLRKREVTWDGFYEGGFLISWGLFEKIFIAGNLARIVDPIFGGPGPYQGAAVLLALYAFAFQIFCDFDAYSNMARGLAKCMGFELIFNFNLPYFSQNIREFWQRWHISLSTWLRDYLYIPLGGSRGSSLLTYRNLLLTMLLGGLWHGAAWTFVAWGVYHGVCLSVHRFWSTHIKSKGTARGAGEIPHFIKIIVCFHVVTLGWLFFRAQSMGQVKAMAQSLVFNFHFSSQDTFAYLVFALIVLPLIGVQVGQYLTKDLMFLYRQHWVLKTVAYAFLTYLVLGWGVMRAEEFIYFQF